MTMDTNEAFFFFETGQDAYAVKAQHQVEVGIDDVIYKAYKTHREIYGKELPREILRVLEAGWKSMEDSER